MCDETIQESNFKTVKLFNFLILHNEIILIHNEMIILFKDIAQAYIIIVSNNKYTIIVQEHEKSMFEIENGKETEIVFNDNQHVIDYINNISKKNVKWGIQTCETFDKLCDNKFKDTVDIFNSNYKNVKAVLKEIHKLTSIVNAQTKLVEDMLNIYDELNITDEYIKFSPQLNHIKMKLILYEQYINDSSDTTTNIKI